MSEHKKYANKLHLHILPIIGLAVLALGIFLWGRELPKTSIKSPQAEEASSEEVPADPFPLTKFENEFTYVETFDGCGPYHNGGPCINVRSGPGTDFPSVAKLRNGVVLQAAGTFERDGHTWYKIEFKEWLRYPERITSDWYIAGDFVKVISDLAPEDRVPGAKYTGTKHIFVNIKQQMLYAYDGEELFMKQPISTGMGETPTEPGTFAIFRKVPSRYMQGPLPGSTDEYDLPGVPWSMYFTVDGAVIHGAYWHNHFGTPASHGCVNMPPEKAEELYRWADLGMKVTILEP
jgi:hypothetical protein